MRFYTRVVLFSIALLMLACGLSANAQMDLGRARWKMDSMRSELSSREKDLLESQKALLRRREEIDRGIAAYMEERMKTDDALNKVRHELNRIHLELLD